MDDNIILGKMLTGDEIEREVFLGGMLTGEEIERQIRLGNIEIDPFDKTCINPNSYNLKLYPELVTYSNTIIDMHQDNPIKKFTIDDNGIVLMPNILYLGRTVERCKSDKFIPMINGRSSGGRLGISIHICAGFGDIGFAGYWTLELFCLQPIMIYPNADICQIYYHDIHGEYDLYNSGKYQNNTGVQPSLMYKDFEQKEK